MFQLLNSKACLALSAVVVLVGCGGRQANPVAQQRAIDAQLTCAHLSGERSFNMARIEDLLGELEASDQNNFALLVTSPLFIDLSDSEQTEIEALHSRNEELDRLLVAKNCS
ncbi:MAG: hypothetical protein AAGC81_15285 [Pseudomonadota bacterium]